MGTLILRALVTLGGLFRMNEFVTGKRGVTIENAVALSLLTGTTPDFWIVLQGNYDRWHGIQKARKVKMTIPGTPFPRTR